MDLNSIEFKIDEVMETDETDFLMVSSVEKEPPKEEIKNSEVIFFIIILLIFNYYFNKISQIKKKPNSFAADIEADDLYENPCAIQIARHSKRQNDKWELEWDEKNLAKILLHKLYNGKKVNLELI